MGSAIMAATSPDSDIPLSGVEVRLVHSMDEKARWDALVREHHYLPWHRLFGKALHHVAIHDGNWLALIGWQVGAFKVGVRDRWIGWTAEQQFSRLHLVAGNARYVLLGRDRPRNLASRVLALSLRRLSADMEKVHGYPVYLAETFVDISRFAGTCYRASNWRSLGLTRGFARRPGAAPRWHHHGQAKEVFVIPLHADARQMLCADTAPHAMNGSEDAPLPDAQLLGSLHDHLAGMADFRRARGQRYSLAFYFTIMIAARLCGYRGYTAFAEFARRLDQEQLAAIGAFRSPSRGRYTTPVATSFLNILQHMPPDALDAVFRDWAAARSDGGAALALDGKTIRGASRQLEGDEKVITIAAVEHGTGLVVGQVRVAEGSNEIPALRDLAARLGKRIITADAMHVQHETAAALVDAGGDYVLTAVKGNQKGMHEQLRLFGGWDGGRMHAEEAGKQHGRIEQRHCTVVDVSGPEWNSFCPLHGRRQAFRIIRKREVVKTGETSIETVYGLTSLGKDQAGAREIADHVRSHWRIETKLHYVRDFTYDEDRCRAHVGNVPENLAAISNMAISLIRLDGRFDYVPPANRHFAARPLEALDAVMS